MVAERFEGDLLKERTDVFVYVVDLTEADEGVEDRESMSYDDIILASREGERWSGGWWW